MLWVFQGQLNSEENKEFESIINDIGDKFLQIEPFGSPKKINSTGEEVVIFGSLSFCSKAINEEFVPGVYCNLEKLKCSSYYPYFYDYLMNKNHIFLPFGCLKGSKDRLYDMLGVGDCLFIRPSSGFKDFTGQIVDKYRFEKDLDSFGHIDFYKDMMCVISSPKNILSEYRLFIARNEIVGKSSYRINKAISHHEKVPLSITDFAIEALVNVEWRPEPLFVMDVAEYYEDGEVKIGIVELNSFSTSGFYGIDKKSFIKKTRKHILLDIEENFYGI